MSSFGSYVTLLALQTLVVLNLDGSTQDVGWLTSSRWLPYLVLGLVIAAWVDRWPRRPVMIGSDLLRSLLLCAIPVTWWAGVLTLPLLLVLVFAFGVVSLVNDAASQSFVPRLVPRRYLQPAHARLDASDATAQAGGPAVAGGLVSALGAPVAVLVDAASYLFSAAVVAGIRVEEPAGEGATGEPRRLRREIADGVRWVYAGSGLARLAVSTHVWFTGQAIVSVVVAPYALLVLELSPLQLGLALALAGVGAVFGATLSGRVGRWLGTGGTIICARLLSAAGALVTSSAGLVGEDGGSAAVALLAGGQLLHGLGMGLSNSHEEAYRQLRTPDELLTRTIITMRSVNRAVLVVGAPLAGLLATLTSDTALLLVAATVFAISAVILLVSSVRSDRSTVGGGHD